MMIKKLLTLAALCVGICAQPLFAQNNGVPPVPLADDSGNADAGEASVPAETNTILKDGMMFPSASIIRVILPIYQDLTDKRVILDTNIADNNVRIVLQGPVSREDAVAFIEETLLLNGYAFVPTTREETVKLLNVAGKNPGPEGAAVYNDQMPLPDTDEVITYIMGLENIMPEEAMQVFQVSTPLHPYGSIAPVPNTSSLVITENVSLIRRLLTLREAIDKPSASVEREFIQLERADAERVAELLQEILAPDDSAENRLAQARERFIQRQNRQNNRGNNQQGNPANEAGNTGAISGNLAGSEGSAPPVKIVPDVRTNRILVMARAVDVAYVRGLVKEFDEPNTARTFLQRQLSHTSAANILPLIADAIGRETGEQVSGGSASGQSGFSQNTSSQLGGRNNNFQRNSGGQGFGGGSNSGGLANSSQGFRSNSQPMPAGATSQIVGKTLLIADNEQNAIIVSGPPEYIELSDKLIEKLDVRQRQVVLATVIGQFNLSDRTEVGVDILRTLDNINSNPEINIAGQNNTGSGAGIVDTNTLTDIANFPDASGLSIYGRFAGNLSAYVRALESTGNFRVLSRPVVFTGNNQEAVIQSGQRIAVPGTTLTSTNGGVGVDNAAISSTIQYRDVVLQLQITPLINSDDQVRLQIYQVNDTIAGSTVVGGNEVPTIATQELVTTVTVESGQSVLIGGLITETEQKNRSGVPILKDIPLVKYLFSTRTTEIRRDELMIFIQPWIVDDEESLKKVNLSEFDRAEGGKDILRFADPRAQTEEVPLPIWDGKVSDHPDVEVRKAIPVKEKIHNALFD